MLDTVFIRILDMSKIACMVIAVVLLARLCLKRAPKVISYALWAVVLFRLLCPISIETAVSILPETVPVAENYRLEEEPIDVVGATVAAYQAAGDVLNGGIGIQHIPTTETDVAGNTRYASATWSDVWLLFGSYVWLAGIAVMLIRATVQTVRLRRRLVGAVPMGKGVFLADHIDSPFVMGLIRPKIYLPSSLDAHEREYILLHERHHIRRGDHITRALGFVALCLHWFNPFVWAAFILSGRDMEMSCDEAVVRRLGGEIRADYAASLLRLTTGRRAIAPTPLAFGEGNTGGRIRNLSKWKKPLLIVVIIAVVVCAVLAVCLLTDPITERQTALAGSVYQLDFSIKDDSYTMVGTNEANAKEHVRLMNELEQFWVTADMHLYVEFEELETEYWGALETYEMSERMRELIGQRVTDAYILRREDQRFLLFAQTKKGDTLYAYGWEDIAERDDYHSDDTRLYALWHLESVLKTNYDLTKFFGVSLIHSIEREYAAMHVFDIAEMPGYTIAAFAGSMSDLEHMTDMGYAVFKACNHREGYRLLDWHIYPNAVTTGAGIHIADPAVLSDNGKMTDRNTYDVILSANEDLGKIVRYGENPNEGVVSVIDSEFSMTVFSWKDFAKDKTVSTVFYNKDGERMVVDMPERVSVTKIVDNTNTGTAILSEIRARELLNAMENAPFVELTHPVYGNGTTFRSGYVIRVEYVIHDEYILHDDMVDCFVWEYNGEYFLDGYKDPEDGKHIQKLDPQTWESFLLHSMTYPFPEQITVMKYADGVQVGETVITDEKQIAYWSEEMKAPQAIVSLAFGATGHKYDNGYVLRMEYAEKDVARDGVPYLDAHVWVFMDNVYYDGYAYPNDSEHTTWGLETWFMQLEMLFSAMS